MAFCMSGSEAELETKSQRYIPEAQPQDAGESFPSKCLSLLVVVLAASFYSYIRRILYSLTDKEK